MVVVVPPLAEGQPAHPPVVARLVAGGVLLRAPRVRGGVDEPRHVVEHLVGARVGVGVGATGLGLGLGFGLITWLGTEVAKQRQHSAGSPPSAYMRP